MDIQIETVKQITEALLFASNNPLAAKKVISIIKELHAGIEISKKEVKDVIASLNQEYAESRRSFEITEVGEGYLLQTKPEFESYLQKLYPTKAVKLSASALETLAIIAYQQPITKAEIEQIRGVDASYPLQLLLERNLVLNHKKLDAPGHPSLFQTSPFFLEYFGLKSLKELPKLPENIDSTNTTEQQSLPDPVQLEE